MRVHAAGEHCAHDGNARYHAHASRQRQERSPCAQPVRGNRPHDHIGVGGLKQPHAEAYRRHAVCDIRHRRVRVERAEPEQGSRNDDQRQRRQISGRYPI